MARGNEIVLSVDPKGHFTEGIVSGTPKPGTFMTIKQGVEPDGGGRLTYEVFDGGGTDGVRRGIYILREDNLQGKTKDTAYADGDRCFLYKPLPGDELNVLVKNISGTSDSFAIGDQLIIDDATGKAIATTGSVENEPLEVMETVAAITEDTHVHCLFTGV